MFPHKVIQFLQQQWDCNIDRAFDMFWTCFCTNNWIFQLKTNMNCKHFYCKDAINRIATMLFFGTRFNSFLFLFMKFNGMLKCIAFRITVWRHSYATSFRINCKILWRNHTQYFDLYECIEIILNTLICMNVLKSF